ncbi:MAG TPA: hypothetical protein VGK59_18255 [Ohtaekwangia sp.]
MTAKRIASVKNIIALLFLVFGMICNGYSQVEFEKGYIIDKNDNRIECLIKNLDWKNNPEIVKYKIDPTDEEMAATLETVKAFQVYGYSKYIVSQVDIDRSPDELSNLSSSRDPIWSSEKLFLEVLIEGKASLYKYESANFTRFFYTVDTAPVQQLVHKEYKVEGGVDNYTVQKVGENNTFQQQLLNEVNCGGVTVSQVKLIRYSESELVKYFKKYNVCNGGESGKRVENEAATTERVKRDVFIVKVSPGMNYTQLTATSPAGEDHEYEKTFSPRLGIEGEFIFPFNKNKLSFLFEPSFQSYKADKTSGSGSIDYASIEFPVGLRYYFYLNQTSRIFLNLHYVPVTPFIFNSKLKIRSDYELEIKTGDNFAIGAGFASGRFSGEVRYYLRKEMTRNYSLWDSPLKTVSFILGYQLFKIKSKG